MINVMEQFFSFIYSGEKLNDDKYHFHKHKKKYLNVVIFQCQPKTNISNINDLLID